MTAPLHFDLISDDSATPERWMYLVHGIYGAGRNWNAVARRLAGDRPDWGVVSIDLRGHGNSPPGSSPHTVGACADDLVALAKSEGAPPADAVLGHSFGGKVAALFSARAPSVRSLIVVDSTPSARPPGGSAWKMLKVLGRNPGPFPDRDAGIAALEAEDYSRPVSQWMGTNLIDQPDTGGWGWRLDIDQMESLLRDFFDLDAWPALRQAAEDGVRVDLLRATESSIMDEADRTRLAELSDAGLAVRLTPVQGGHWLNADNPDRVVELLTERLPRT